MLLPNTKRNAALSMLLHLVVLAIIWMVFVRKETTNGALGQLTGFSIELNVYPFVLALFLLISISMLLLRYLGNKKFWFPFLYQFTGIGNLVYATFGLVLFIMGAAQGIIVWILLSFLTGFFIEKDIFTADTDRR